MPRKPAAPEAVDTPIEEPMPTEPATSDVALEGPAPLEAEPTPAPAAPEEAPATEAPPADVPAEATEPETTDAVVAAINTKPAGPKRKRLPFLYVITFKVPGGEVTREFESFDTSTYKVGKTYPLTLEKEATP